MTWWVIALEVQKIIVGRLLLGARDGLPVGSEQRGAQDVKCELCQRISGQRTLPNASSMDPASNVG